MVARIRPAAGLRVTLHRNGNELESDIASTGEAAVKAAVLILIRQDALEAGDRLTVNEV
jgi:hypothetical protein